MLFIWVRKVEGVGLINHLCKILYSCGCQNLGGVFGTLVKGWLFLIYLGEPSSRGGYELFIITIIHLCEGLLMWVLRLRFGPYSYEGVYLIKV